MIENLLRQAPQSDRSETVSSPERLGAYRTTQSRSHFASATARSSAPNISRTPSGWSRERRSVVSNHPTETVQRAAPRAVLKVIVGLCELRPEYLGHLAAYVELAGELRKRRTPFTEAVERREKGEDVLLVARELKIKPGRLRKTLQRGVRENSENSWSKAAKPVKDAQGRLIPWDLGM